MADIDLALVPGLNNTAAVFEPMIAHMPPAIRCRTLTLPALESIDALAGHFLAAMPERFWLCGFSLGGYVALRVLEMAPARVQGFALLCSSTRADSPAQAQGRGAAIEAVRKGDYVALIAAQAANALGAEALGNPALVAARTAMLVAYGKDRFIAHQTAARDRTDRTGVMKDFAGPKLVIAASEDRLFRPQQVQDDVVAPTGADFLVIARSGHLAPLERPGEVAAAIRGWIETRAQ